MKQVLAIRHVYFEDLGILEPELIKLGYKINYVEAPLVNFLSINLIDYDLIVILGAPIGAFDEALYPFLNTEIALIKQAISAQIPTLGICLGAQLIARILGAKVYAMPQKEIGFSVLSINLNIPHNPLITLENIPVLHWHGDQFDIPEKCQILASTPLCPNQAFTYKNHVLALQFHMEADPIKLEQWLVGHCHELNSNKTNLHQLRIDAQKYGHELTDAGRRTFLNWLANVSIK